MFTQMRSNLKFLGSILFALVFLMGGILTVKSAQAADLTVSSQIDQYTVNDGTNFIRSSAPQSLSTNGGTVSQTTNNGSVTVNASSATGYADSGFYTKWMKIGELKSISVTGSGPYGVNIWLDTNTGNDADTNGKFFTWNNGSYTNWGGYDGDKSLLGPSSNDTLTINDASLFDGSINGVYGSYTLADLKTQYPNTDIAFWVGVTVMTGGSKSATISRFDVVAPVSNPTVTIWSENLNKSYLTYAPNTIFQANVNFDGGLTLSDFNAVEISLYNGTTLLATNTAKPALFSTYPNAVGATDLFGIGDTEDLINDSNWNIGAYSSNLTPTSVKFTLTRTGTGGAVYTVTGSIDAESTAVLDADAAALALTNAKTAAHTALNNTLATYTQGNYTAENWTILTGFKSAGDTAINNAGTTGDVTSAQNTATTGMSGVAVINRSHSSGSRAATPAIPATPAVPGISPAIPATPAVPAGKVLGAEKFNFTKFLKFKAGSYKVSLQGPEVIELQKFLATLGYDIGIADGKFGSKTNAAVIKFQIANGLKGDGVIGALTRAILNK